jgi:hypothetical protein
VAKTSRFFIRLHDSALKNEPQQSQRGCGSTSFLLTSAKEEILRSQLLFLIFEREKKKFSLSMNIVVCFFCSIQSIRVKKIKSLRVHSTPIILLFSTAGGTTSHANKTRKKILIHFPS